VWKFLSVQAYLDSLYQNSTVEEQLGKKLKKLFLKIFNSVILALVRLRRMNPESFFAYRRIPDKRE